MCECGDTLRGPCPRCERRIDRALDDRHSPDPDRADRAEARHDRYILGGAA